MARIKLAYIGGGSTRAPGTVASFIEQGENFAGSEVVLIDLHQERLDLVQTIARKMARNRNVDIAISTSTDRRAGLAGCDAVLTSFRPGGFEARYLDESIPLRHGVIGQETQGPGGFFMALRSIHAMQAIVADMEAVCPRSPTVQLHQPGQHRGRGRLPPHRHPDRLALRRPHLHPRGAGPRRRPGPRPRRGHDHRP